MSPGYSEFKDWKADKVAANIQNSPSLTDANKKWWRRFFRRHPKVYNVSVCSRANVPRLFTMFQKQSDFLGTFRS